MTTTLEVPEEDWAAEDAKHMPIKAMDVAAFLRENYVPLTRVHALISRYRDGTVRGKVVRQMLDKKNDI